MTPRLLKAIGIAQIIVAIILRNKDTGIAITFAVLGVALITLPHTPTQKQRQKHRRCRWR